MITITMSVTTMNTITTMGTESTAILMIRLPVRNEVHMTAMNQFTVTCMLTAKLPRVRLGILSLKLITTTTTTVQAER
nr:hypothetical protein BaRGS_024955 [Batillaria attramentaria]